MSFKSSIAPAVAAGIIGALGLGVYPATSSPLLRAAAVGEAVEANLVAVHGTQRVAPRRAANRAYIPRRQVIGDRRISTGPGTASVALVGPVPYTGPNAAAPEYPVSSARDNRRGAFASAVPQAPFFEEWLFDRAKGNAENY